MTDCGHGRVAIWRRVRTETAKEIEKVIEEVFLERGAAEEVLLDKGVGFRSKVFRELVRSVVLGDTLDLRTARAAMGIIKRHHRTIKAVAEKNKILPQEAVFWYNMAPKTGQDEASVPH